MSRMLALAVAAAAHEGQTDKAGQPYIGHPIRVALSLEDWLGQELSAIASHLFMVALLHDVIEDTDETPGSLQRAGLEQTVATDVMTMTHAPNEPYMEYIERVGESNIAALVKCFDILDNSHPDRLAALDDKTRTRLLKKYAPAYAYLKERLIVRGLSAASDLPDFHDEREPINPPLVHEVDHDDYPI